MMIRVIMMIIDTHVHIGKMLGFDLKGEDVLYSMDRYGIDFSLVSSIEAAEYDHRGRRVPARLRKTQNEIFRDTLRFASVHPDRIGAVPWLRVAEELPNEEFVALLRQNRSLVYAFKLHPFHSRVAPDDLRLEAVYRLAAEYDLPIVSHTGGCEEARSLHLYNAAKRHPELNFVMVHMDLGTDNSAALELLGTLPNLYGDTTWVPVSTTLKAIERWGSGKMLFGSDNPIDGKDTYLHNRTGDRSLYQQYFNEFRESVSADDYDNIMYRNAMRVFHIKKEGFDNVQKDQ